MSGIFGIIHRDGRPVDAADLERMRDAMAHRGPDGSRIWIQGSAGLGQLMLCSTPESLHETLPWKDPESGLVITADARIDNRDELAAQFGPSTMAAIKGRLAADHAASEPYSIPDSQFILEAYKRWGEACVEQLLGDFAFAIWDAQEKRLFCARDHMGIRPFYYYWTRNLLVFGSSALGVVAAAAVPRRVSDVRIADFLVEELEGADKVCTWFEGVCRMPPAHFAVFDKDAPRLCQYWEPAADCELHLSSENEYVDAFEEAITDAIRSRMRCNRPVSSMLSGGLDSSAIVGFARQIQEKSDGQIFNVIAGVSESHEECTERKFVESIIAQGGLAANLLRPSQVGAYAERLRKVESILEDPFDSLWIMHKMIYLCARDSGFSTVMDGIDGDGVTSLTASYPVFLMRGGHLWQAHKQLLGLSQNYLPFREAVWRRYRSALSAAFVPEWLKRTRRALQMKQQEKSIADSLLSSSYPQLVSVKQRLEKMRAESGLLDCPSLRLAHAKRVTVPYLTAGIERYGRLAALAGIEHRQPLLDKRFIEFCISLPWERKINDGIRKITLRRAAARVLPHEVAWQTGWGRVNWKFWYRWKDTIAVPDEAIMRSVEEQISQMVDKKKLQESLNLYNVGRVGATEQILALIGLLNWLRNNRIYEH